jgi:hypothetical protein
MVSNNKIVIWVPIRMSSKGMLRQQPRDMVHDLDPEEINQVSVKHLNSKCPIEIQ